jgi:hypothetical protein
MPIIDGCTPAVFKRCARRSSPWLAYCEGERLVAEHQHGGGRKLEPDVRTESSAPQSWRRS